MSEFALLILAGGYSERFDEKKAFYEVDGKPLIRYVLEKVSQISEEIVISCKSDVEKLREEFPNPKVIEDELDTSAPLVGFLSSLPTIQSAYTAVITCDNPKVKPEVLNMLYKKAEGHSAAVPRWPNGYLEPLTAVYRTKELERYARQAWDNKIMKLSNIVEKLPDVVFVPTEEIEKLDPELDTFLNLNTPEKVKSELETKSGS